MQKTLRGKDVATGESREVAFDETILDIRSAAGPGDVYLSPGWIDVQVNGFAAVDYNSTHTSHEEIARSIQVLFSTGVTRFYPTVITGAWKQPPTSTGSLPKYHCWIGRKRTPAPLTPT